MYRVAIYARISTTKQDKGLSIPAQIIECQQYATQQGWSVVREYQEIKSGRNDKRPQFLKMSEDAEQGLFDLILVHDFSRFARSREVHVLYESKFAEWGVALISKTEPVEKTAAGRLMKHVLSDFNAYYSDQLAMHTKKGMLQKIRKGEWPGLLPWGYVRRDKKCVIDEVEGPRVRFAFEQFATEKYTLNEWQHEAFKLGYQTKKGTKIDGANWSRIFHNIFYIGKMVWSEQTYDGGHEALVDIVTFEKIQEILANRTTPKYIRRFYPLTGLLWSVDACERMSGANGKGKSGDSWRYYVSMAKSKLNGRSHYAKSDVLEERFAQFLYDVYVEKEIMDTDLKQIDREIFMMLKVANSVGHVYAVLVDYQKLYLSKLVVEPFGIKIKGEQIQQITLKAPFFCTLGSSENRCPIRQLNTIIFQ
jgi:DNA invertase Pin-like site-specific DNA recombinase